MNMMLKLFITFFLQMISLYKSHFHVHYEEVYLYERFQKLSIKTLTRLVYPNFINKQETSLSPLEVNVSGVENRQMVIVLFEAPYETH